MDHMIKASKAVGLDVWNMAGEFLGHIQEIYIDHLQGKVVFMTMKHMGKILPIPHAAFTYRPTDKCFVLHVDLATLKAAPGYKKPFEFDTRTKQEEVYSHYGYAPYWE